MSRPIEVRMTETRHDGSVHYEIEVSDGSSLRDPDVVDVALVLARGVADRLSVGPGPAGPEGMVRLVWLQAGGPPRGGG